MMTGGKADPRVRLRIFAYLRENGIEVGTANRVASKLVGAMAGKGALPAAAATLAGAGLGSNPANEKAAYGLLEPKAEPYEASGGGLGGGHGGLRGAPGKPGLGGASFGRPGPSIGRGSHVARPTGAMGGAVNFAIIEPVTTRREVQAKLGTSLTRGQVQQFVGLVDRSLRAK